MRLRRKFQKVLFYLSSFIPLYMLLIIQNIHILDSTGDYLSVKEFFKQFYTLSIENTFFWFILLLLIILSLFGVILFFFIYRRNEGRKGTIKNTEYIREDTLGYIVTYIVPLISMNIDSGRSLLINFILFIIIGTFYVKNDQIFMNPLYNIFGYNVFSAEENIYITKISKSKIKNIAKNRLPVTKINIMGDIYILTQNKNKTNKDEDDLF